MKAYTTNNHDHKGFTIRVSWHYDESHGTPWDEEDGHGPVSDWTRYNPNCGDGGKAAGQRVLCSDRGSVRFYDWEAAVKTAEADGWGLGADDKAKLAAKLKKPVESLTKGEIVNAAVIHDFKYLRDWCNNEWHYCGYTVEIEDDNGEEIAWDSDSMGEDSLWGIDSPSCDHFEDEAVIAAKSFIDGILAERANMEQFSQELQFA